MLIDTHAHLNWDSYKEDFQDMLDRSVNAGVGIVINIGTNALSSQEVCAIESPKLKMYATVGIHPEEASLLKNDADLLQETGELENLYQEHSTKVVGIGECGLDYFHLNHVIPSAAEESFSPDPSTKVGMTIEEKKHWQKKLFAIQAFLAKQLSLPLIVHCRDAWEDIFIPELEGTTGVFHTFSGTMADAKKALDLGYYLSFSCTVTYPKNEDLRQVLKEVPLERIVTETDSPFLPPQALRGQRNEPMHIAEVIKVISTVKGISEAEVEEAIEKNAHTLFKL